MTTVLRRRALDILRILTLTLSKGSESSADPQVPPLDSGWSAQLFSSSAEKKLGVARPR